MEREFRIAGAVAAGGALGAVARAGVAAALEAWGAASLWSLLVINVAGALALGWYLSRGQARVQRPALVASFVAIGFLGSFTTFSAFSLEVVLMFENGAWFAASSYVATSVVAGLAALLAGRRLAESR